MVFAPKADETDGKTGEKGSSGAGDGRGGGRTAAGRPPDSGARPPDTAGRPAAPPPAAPARPGEPAPPPPPPPPPPPREIPIGPEDSAGPRLALPPERAPVDDDYGSVASEDAALPSGKDAGKKEPGTKDEDSGKPDEDSGTKKKEEEEEEDVEDEEIDESNIPVNPADEPLYCQGPPLHHMRLAVEGGSPSAIGRVRSNKPTIVYLLDRTKVGVELFVI